MAWNQFSNTTGSGNIPDVSGFNIPGNGPFNNPVREGIHGNKRVPDVPIFEPPFIMGHEAVSRTSRVMDSLTYDVSDNRVNKDKDRYLSMVSNLFLQEYESSNTGVNEENCRNKEVADCAKDESSNNKDRKELPKNLRDQDWITKELMQLKTVPSKSEIVDHVWICVCPLKIAEVAKFGAIVFGLFAGVAYVFWSFLSNSGFSIPVAAIASVGACLMGGTIQFLCHQFVMIEIRKWLYAVDQETWKKLKDGCECYQGPYNLGKHLLRLCYTLLLDTTPEIDFYQFSTNSPSSSTRSLW